MNRKTLLAAVLLGATALGGPIACKMAGTDPAAMATPGTGLGFTLANMDKTVKPGDDFYGYANGNWQKATEIPADRSSISNSFIAQQATEANMKELVDGLNSSTPAARPAASIAAVSMNAA